MRIYLIVREDAAKCAPEAARMRASPIVQLLK